MPRYNNYSLVADTSFNPYQSMQEMLVPFTAYKDAYEKQEALLDEINQNTDTFKYLEQVAKDNPESEAARIYNNYADELKRQAADFSANGLTMANRRSLSNLKRRYQGEIGLLDTASKAMEEEKKLRRQLGAKDHSMLYATDNLNIDDFLYGKNPNLYSVSGNELYTKGAALGKAASSRVYKAGDEGSVLGGYYRNWKESRGVSQESIADFMNSDAVQQEVDNMLRAEGVAGNLTGANYERARQQVLNGIYTGIVYEESNKPVRDAGVMSAAERDSSARAWAANNRAQEQWNIQKDLMYQKNEKTGKWELNPNYASNNYEVDPNTGKLKKKTTASSPEEAAVQEMQKKEILERVKNAQKVKRARTVEEADKAGYVPVLATVHPSHGASAGLSVEEARRQQKYDNIEGWRSGRQGSDVPGVYIDWTNAPLVEGSQSAVPDLFQWFSGSSSSPNNGDFSYNLKGAQTKMLSDQEYDKLPESVRISIEEGLREQGYEENTPFEVMQVTGRGGKTSYMTLVSKDDQILLGD